MKNYRFIIPLLALLGFVMSCKKNKPDERIFARWKITEYYLDGQPAYDTIVKYLEGFEYQIIDGTPDHTVCYMNLYLNNSTWSTGIKHDIGDEAINMLFADTKVMPPLCQNGQGEACFECATLWAYSFIDANTMEWNAKSVNNYPVTRQHRLTFVRIN